MLARGRDTAEHYSWGDSCDGWRLLSRDDLSVIEERISPGQGEVRHVHARARQLFYVLTGRLVIDLPDGPVVVAARQALEVSPTVVHRVHNPFDHDAVFLVISAPTTTGDRTNM